MDVRRLQKSLEDACPVFHNTAGSFLSFSVSISRYFKDPRTETIRQNVAIVTIKKGIWALLTLAYYDDTKEWQLIGSRGLPTSLSDNRGNHISITIPNTLYNGLGMTEDELDDYFQEEDDEGEVPDDPRAPYEVQPRLIHVGTDIYMCQLGTAEIPRTNEIDVIVSRVLMYANDDAKCAMFSAYDIPLIYAVWIHNRLRFYVNHGVFTDINKLINCEIIGVDRLPSILERGGRC